MPPHVTRQLGVNLHEQPCLQYSLCHFVVTYFIWHLTYCILCCLLHAWWQYILYNLIFFGFFSDPKYCTKWRMERVFRSVEARSPSFVPHQCLQWKRSIPFTQFSRREFIEKSHKSRWSGREQKSSSLFTVVSFF